MAILTTAAVALIAKELAVKGFEKAFDTSVEKISEDAITWIKKLFMAKGTPRQELVDLQARPESLARLNGVTAIFDRELEDNPSSVKYLEEIYEKLVASQTNITNSKNINTGTINANNGNVQLGDNYAK